MNNIINSIYSITYSIVILGAIMMGMGAVYQLSYPVPGEPVIYNIIGLIVFLSAFIQIILSLQGYRMCHVR